MIVNLDDLKYVLHRVHNQKLYDLLQYTELENMGEHQIFGWALYIISAFFVQSRCVEFEPFLNNAGHYFLFKDFYNYYNWPEIEEQIRRHSDYKFWYESDTGMRI